MYQEAHQQQNGGYSRELLALAVLDVAGHGDIVTSEHILKKLQQSGAADLARSQQKEANPSMALFVARDSGGAAGAAAAHNEGVARSIGIERLSPFGDAAKRGLGLS